MSRRSLIIITTAHGVQAEAIPSLITPDKARPYYGNLFSPYNFKKKLQVSWVDELSLNSISSKEPTVIQRPVVLRLTYSLGWHKSKDGCALIFVSRRLSPKERRELRVQLGEDVEFEIKYYQISKDGVTATYLSTDIISDRTLSQYEPCDPAEAMALIL